MNRTVGSSLEGWRSAAGAMPGRRRGQSLVEFALVLPILLVLVFGIIEFGNAWRTSQLITNFAREGARRSVAANGSTETEIRNAINNMMTANGLDTNRATIDFRCDGAAYGSGTCNSDESGKPESVRIRYQYAFDFFGPRFGTITLETESTMRKE